MPMISHSALDHNQSGRRLPGGEARDWAIGPEEERDRDLDDEDGGRGGCRWQTLT